MRIFLIISCEKNRSLKNVIEQSWLKDLAVLKKPEFTSEFKYFFVYGHPELEEDFKIEKKEIWVKCGDHYEDLPLKVYLGLKAIYANFLERGGGEELEGVFKVDDDVYVRLGSLKQRLPELLNVDYGGHINQVYQDYYSEWHFGKCHNEALNRSRFLMLKGSASCSGPFYYLSRRALIAYVNLPFSSRTIYEDICLAESLKHIGILPMHLYNFKVEADDLELWRKNSYIVALHDTNHQLLQYFTEFI